MSGTEAGEARADGGAGWVAVCPSDRLGPLPRRVEVGGREVVVWRRPDTGTVAALDDRCAHQEVRLSNGSVLPDGCIVCPGHGWTYRPGGTNALSPGSGDVPAHDADERDGQVWVRLRAPAPRPGPDRS